LSKGFILVVAFGAFQAANLLNRHGFFFEGLVQALIVRISSKVYLGLAMAVDTPAHAQVAILIDFFHFFDRTMTGLASDTTDFDVLGVVEVDQVWEVVDADPFDGFTTLPGF
jgi:hypothetical protein